MTPNTDPARGVARSCDETCSRRTAGCEVNPCRDADPRHHATPNHHAIRNRVHSWAARLGVQPRSVRIRPMTRKWGSCSTAGNVTLAADLASQPPGFQDFVVAHELLHLRIPNHGKLFKALMTAYVPDWREHDLRRRAAMDKPRLLSGGNPQIPKGDGDAPVQAYIEAMPGWKRDVGWRLDALVVRAVPDARKGVRWNSPFYGMGNKSWFMCFHCFTKYVKVTFLRGASLRPLPPVGSKDKHTRYFHVHDGDEIDEELVTNWVRQASELPGWVP